LEIRLYLNSPFLTSFQIKFLQLGVNRPLGPQIAPEENDSLDPEGPEIKMRIPFDDLRQRVFSFWGSHPAQSQMGLERSILGGKTDFGGCRFDFTLEPGSGAFFVDQSRPNYAGIPERREASGSFRLQFEKIKPLHDGAKG
jgi:hypothetical protein